MPELGVMIEAQEGLSWGRWRRIVADVERLGFAALRTSDHCMSVFGVADRESLAAWPALALAAEWTERIQLGPMVSPMTFHHPAILARKAAAVDLLSGGRLILGVGAGWNEREHEMFGVPFFTVKERMDLLENGIVRIRDTWKKSSPKAAQNPIPLLMGGRGEKRALPMIAREASEWNLSHMDAAEYRQKRGVLEENCRAIGRDPATIRHSVMATYIIGRDHDDLRERTAKLRDFLPSLRKFDIDGAMTEVRRRGLVGTPAEIVEQIRGYAALGVDLFMLQHFLLDDHDALQLLASDVIPAVA